MSAFFARCFLPLMTYWDNLSNNPQPFQLDHISCVFFISGGYSSNPRPDVVPGSVVDDENDFSAVGGDSSSSQATKSSSTKPKHKQHQQVKKMGNAESRRLANALQNDLAYSTRNTGKILPQLVLHPYWNDLAYFTRNTG